MAYIGIVIVHYGDPTPTRGCVGAIAQDPSPVDRTIVVVDNSGNLDAGEFDGGSVLVSSTNIGYGAGANLGAATLTRENTDTLVVLNHDVEIAPGFLAAALRATSLPGVAAAAGPLYLDSDRRRLWYAGGGVNRLTGTVWQSRRPSAARRERDVGFLPGAAVAFDYAAFLTVGGFDPRFFLYNEDLDIGLRLRRCRYRLRYVPEMAAVHHLGAATGSHAYSPLYLEHLSRTRLRPFHPLAYRCYLAALHTPYVALRAAAVLALRGARGKAAMRALLRGHWQALSTIREGPRGV
ncbi:MAG: glycosyltransferase family 2 protein [Acidobacteriota bacterium]